MKRIFLLALTLGSVWVSVTQAQFKSRPLGGADVGSDPFKHVGLIIHKPDRGGKPGTGSANIALNSKTFFSAAHVFFSERNYVDGWDPYGGTTWFYPRYHQANAPPDLSVGKRIRGVFAFSSYADRYRDFGQDDPRTFAVDFVVGFSYEPLSGSSSMLPAPSYDGQSLVTGQANKNIVGYPSGNYGDQDFLKYRMHHTGEFNLAFTRVTGRYFATNGVSTGPGNSGGPIFVRHGNHYLCAGILVSGLRIPVNPVDSSGIYVLSSDILPLVEKAARQTDREIATETGDFDTLLGKYRQTTTGKPISTTGDGEILEVSVTGRVSPHRSRDWCDMPFFNARIYLVGPNGVKMRVDADPSGYIPVNQTTRLFEGLPAKGDWHVEIQDLTTGDRERCQYEAIAKLGFQVRRVRPPTKQ